MFIENARASNSDDPAVEREARPRLGEIRMPTLVITGARDVRAMTEIGDLLCGRIAGAERTVIEEADDMIPWRSPEKAFSSRSALRAASAKARKTWMVPAKRPTRNPASLNDDRLDDRLENFVLALILEGRRGRAGLL
jgi:pimeloyl-ACP methyl ester carboxylesterase